MMTEDSHEDCSDGAVKISIEKIVPHPQYDKRNKLKRNDIALIRMTEMAPYTGLMKTLNLFLIKYILKLWLWRPYKFFERARRSYVWIYDGKQIKLRDR